MSSDLVTGIDFYFFCIFVMNDWLFVILGVVMAGSRVETLDFGFTGGAISAFITAGVSTSRSEFSYACFALSSWDAPTESFCPNFRLYMPGNAKFTLKS